MAFLNIDQRRQHLGERSKELIDENKQNTEKQTPNKEGSNKMVKTEIDQKTKEWGRQRIVILSGLTLIAAIAALYFGEEQSGQNNLDTAEFPPAKTQALDPNFETKQRGVENVANQQVRVYNTGNEGLILRDQPNGDMIGSAWDGETFQLVTGPVKDGEYDWYQIVDPISGKTYWVAGKFLTSN